MNVPTRSWSDARTVAARLRTALVLIGALAGGHAVAETPVRTTNVPDVVTRKSGLRVAPMARVAQMYATNCQGCHGDLGSSAQEIPTLAGRVGYFTRLPEGRAYLVQVPNVALNPGSDADIAAVLNWVLMTYSRAQLRPDFKPYTAAEVAPLRKARIDVVAERQRVIRDLVAAKQIPSADVLTLPGIVPY